jgi:sulfur carrier protein
MVQLIINGQLQHFSTSAQPLPARSQEATEGAAEGGVFSINQLLKHMALLNKRIAVERNGEIVPRSKFDEPVLASGDRLEIVVAVGGG